MSNYINMYKREYYHTIKSRLEEPRRFLQIVMGPRQVGKTTLVQQVLRDISLPYLYVSADNVAATNVEWIAEQWMTARSRLKYDNQESAILVIDEIQKIRNWSEVVKKLWDEDTQNDVELKVLLLGSSRVLLERGLSDSLMGRFETIRIPHWSYAEMREAFGFTLSQYIYFGAYPAAASMIDDEDRWSEYIRSSIVDATINKDILQDTVVGKPALLRQTFEIASAYSAEILSYTKMLGQLQDAGNTTTLSAYINLLNDSGLVGSFYKFSGDIARQRMSIPKFQVYNNALKTIYCNTTFAAAQRNHALWGRLYESAIGAHLINMDFAYRLNTYYWRDGNDEVDFIVKYRNKLLAIEVKSGYEKMNSGLHAFASKYPTNASIVVGPSAFSPADFLSGDIRKLFE